MGERIVLPDEERAAIAARMVGSTEREAGLRSEGDALKAAREWYVRFDALENKLKELKRERDDNASEREAFAPKSGQLTVAERAATLDDLYDGLKAARIKLENAKDDEKRAVEKAASAEAKAARAKEEAASCAAAYEALRAQADANAELWERVAALDRESENAQKELTEREETVAARKKTLATSEREGKKLRAELERAQAELPQAEHAAEAARTSLEQARDAEHRADLSELREHLIDGQPCPLCGSVHHPSPFAAPAEKEELFRLHELAETARTAADEAESALRHAREEEIRLAAELGAQKTVSETARAESVEAEERAGTSRAELEKKRAVRNELFGENDPAEARRKFQKDLSGAEMRAADARTAETDAKVALVQAQTEQTQQKEHKAALEKELAGLEETFAERLKKQGFRTEEEWRDAALDEETRAALAEERTRLDNRERELAALVPQAQAELSAHGSAPEQPRAGLDVLIDENASALTTLLTSRGADEEAIARDDENRKRLAELSEQEKRQQKKYDVWRSLNDHIGSASGDKFSRYVQGLTFRRLVRAANAQLERLSERYRLRAGDNDALRLDVIDLWQGGEARSSKNLSGGESFIVSLALALALSHGMREVKVDSLFLDEGFGTLDDETLETVLECLDRLRETGRLVGVISHVKQLQERIDCRISVIPDGSGRSRLSGPGCMKMS
jgi:exonuclease SbcC